MAFRSIAKFSAWRTATSFVGGRCTLMKKPIGGPRRMVSTKVKR